MQYGVNVNNYKKVSKATKPKKSTSISVSVTKLILYIVAGILISRVTININFGSFESLAPFGIAYLLSTMERDKKETFSAMVGALVGYLTLFNKVNEFPLYLIVLAVLTIITINPVRLKAKLQVTINFVLIFMSIFLYGTLFAKTDLFLSMVTAFVLTVLIYPIYYMVSYTLKCIDDLKSEHFFSSDEIVSIELFLCLLIVGIGSASIFGISVRSIVSLFFVITISYITDANMGACAGITMGLILGFASGDLLFYTAIYGACGLIAGIFKEAGKVLTFLSFNIIFMVIGLYSQILTRESAIEVVLASGIFLLIPNQVYKKISLEINKERKLDQYSEAYFKKIKDELSTRLRDFTDVLGAMSVTLNTLVSNDKLKIKNKGNALVENLSDRTCSECDMRYLCWKRELNSTYNSFVELINNYEEGRNGFPEELEKKCVRKYALIKNVEETMTAHMINETLKKRLGEGRKLLSGHINNMAITIGEIIEDFDKEVSLCVDAEKAVRKALLRRGIAFGDVMCYNDKYGRLNIKLQMDNCCGAQICVKDVLPIINDAVGRTMSVGGEGCDIDPKTNKCEVLIEEAPKYHIASHAAVSCKQGEKFTGDSYSYGKTKDGNYIVVVSDGMGSGPEAGAESKVTVEIIEKFMEVGFNELTAIDAVNSIMGIKFSEDEKYATLDMQKIDLYSGTMKIMKVGAIESFIKKGNKVEVIEAKALPFGVLETPDIDIVEKNVSNGDLIITISDGVLDVKKDGTFEYDWLLDFLKATPYKQPKDLSIAILEKAKELSGGKVKDDMTVVVSKVYTLH